MPSPDVIVVGSGGGGAVIAKELGELGVRVLVLEAGPWYGHARWPDPNRPGAGGSGARFEELDIALLRRQYTKLEGEMNDLISGRLRWGPADRSRPTWYRNVAERGFVWQTAGVGGTTQAYLANSPRAYPQSVDGIWPIPYRELVPYYEKAEATLPVAFAPMTAKEELFGYAATKAGYPFHPTLDVASAGWRLQPNAILPPNPQLMNADVSLERLSHLEGCTLAGHCINGCPHGPSVDRVAKRSTLVSYVPLALKTGNVAIRPNAFAVKILTRRDPAAGLAASGVLVRDTWTGDTEELTASVIVLSGGCVETPRLWLNSGLPANPWVGRGLVNHYMDYVTGLFDERDLMSMLGSPSVDPFVGHTSGARLDIPGYGSLLATGLSPGLTASMTFGLSQAGYASEHPYASGMPPFARGWVVGPELEKWARAYRRTLGIAVLTDDEPDPRNGVTVDPILRDEHGPIPVVRYAPTPKSTRRRDRLAGIAADLLRAAGAKQIIRSDWPASVMIHLESTMRMGLVVDADCEALQVRRLYIADNSVHVNGVGGVNPTLTTQALATRAAEKLYGKYFA